MTCRFATVEDVMLEEFLDIVGALNAIAGRYDLADHADVNSERFPWSRGLLSPPEIYAARLWEYPFAIHSAQLRPGMKCADVGCGMSAFTIFLMEKMGCMVTGVDPDVFEAGTRYKSHGVSRDFIDRTGLEVVEGDMASLPLASDAFDRAFCLSVIEHVPTETARRGIQQMARILKPGGRLVMTVDVSVHAEMSRPLDLIWDSGLLPLGDLDLCWPAHRFGELDVFGMVLEKSDRMVETAYAKEGSTPRPDSVPLHLVPVLRRRGAMAAEALARRSLWRRMTRRLRKALGVLLHG